MKIFKCDFELVWPVGGGLIIAANTEEEALRIAEETVSHTHVESIEEVDIDKPCVVYYDSGEY